MISADIDDIITGSNRWLASIVLKSFKKEQFIKIADQKLIEWMCINPGTQFVGSFQPSASSWTEDAYLNPLTEDLIAACGRDDPAAVCCHGVDSEKD